MGVLETVLQYKQQQEAQRNADLQAIPQAINVFTQARQAAKKNNLDSLLAQAQIDKIHSDIKNSENDTLLKDIKTSNDLLDIAKKTNNQALFDTTSNSINNRLGVSSTQAQATQDQTTQDQTTQAETLPTQQGSVGGKNVLPSQENTGITNFPTTGHTIETTKLGKTEQMKLMPDDELAKMANKKMLNGELTDDGAAAKALLDRRKTVTADEGNANGPNFQFDKNIRLLKNIVSRPDFDFGPFGAAKIDQEGWIGASFSNPEQQKVRTLLNEIKQLGFSIGGKTLTSTEKNLVLTNIRPVGKSVEEWLQGLDIQNEKVQTKSVAQGGLDARKFDYKTKEDDIQSNRPTDIVPKGDLGNEVLRKVGLANKTLLDLVTLGNSDKVYDFATEHGVIPQELNSAMKALTPQDPIEHLIRGAPGVMVAKDLAQLGVQSLLKQKAASAANATAEALKPSLIKEVQGLHPATNAHSIMTDIKPKVLNMAEKEMEAYHNTLNSTQITKGTASASRAIKVLDKEIKSMNIFDAGGKRLRISTAAERKVINERNYLEKYAKSKNTDEIPSNVIIESSKRMAGKYSKGMVAQNHVAVDAAHELTSVLPEESAKALNAANSRYKNFKTTFNEFDKHMDITNPSNDATKQGVMKILGLTEDPGFIQTAEKMENLIGYKFVDKAKNISDLRNLITHWYNPIVAPVSALKVAGYTLNKFFKGSAASEANVLKNLSEAKNADVIGNVTSKAKGPSNTVRLLQEQEAAAQKASLKKNSKVAGGVLLGSNVDIKKISQIESSNNPEAIGDNGKAFGLNQIHEGALQDFNKANKKSYTTKDLMKADVNNEVAEWYYNKEAPRLLKALGMKDTIENRIRIYNQGYGNIKKGKPTPPKTLEYIKKYNSK